MWPTFSETIATSSARIRPVALVVLLTWLALLAPWPGAADETVRHADAAIAPVESAPRPTVGARTAAPLSNTDGDNADSPTLPETMNENNVMAFVDEHGIASVEAFVEALPPLHRRHFVTVFESASPVADFVSTTHPRVVSWGADARFIVTWTTDPDSPSADTVEFLQPVAEEGRWIAGVVDFSSTTPELRHPDGCAACHSDINRPLWGAYPVWEGTEFELNKVVPPPRQAVFDLYETMRTTTDPRLTPLERGGYDSFERSIPFGDRPDQNPNWEFGTVLTRRHAEVLFDQLRGREDYDAFAQSVMCAKPGSQIRAIDWKVGPIVEQVGTARFNPRLIASSLEPVQGANEGVGEDYTHGNGLSLSILFLVQHDLWKRRQAVADLYGKTRNDERLDSTWQGSWETRRFHPVGSATEEDELLAAYREFFTLRGQASIDERAARRIDPRYGPIFIGLQAGTFEAELCAFLQSPPTADDFDPSIPGVVGFTLVDAEGGAPDPDVRALESGAVINVSGLSAGSAALRADIGADIRIGSVRIELLGPITAAATDDAAPYTLFGDDGLGDYGGTTLPNGDYRIVAMHHVGRDGRDAAGAPMAADFSVTGSVDAPPSPVIGFTLVDAERGEDVASITEGATLDLFSIPSSRFAIRAEVNDDAGVGSVRLALRGPVSATDVEALAPYALYGDDGRGDYWGGGAAERRLRDRGDPLPGARPERRCGHLGHGDLYGDPGCAPAIG